MLDNIELHYITCNFIVLTGNNKLANKQKFNTIQHLKIVPEALRKIFEVI